jgi:ATP-dependent helicase/nuclease subunit A
MTVSELKKLGQLPEDEFSVNLYGNNKQDPLDSLDLQAGTPSASDTKQLQQSDEDAVIPDFISKKQQPVSGTDRGTLYHKVLELIDLTRIYNNDDLETELNRLIQSQRLKESDIKLLKPDYINRFISSNIAKRMRQAEALHKLSKEKQFVIGIKAAEVVPDVDSSELILIQGIIDVFFEEDGELVLLDYKSDLVTEAEQLVKRYKVQLQYYRKALEQILNKKVKETIIYSLPLGREIRIDL